MCLSWWDFRAVYNNSIQFLSIFFAILWFDAEPVAPSEPKEYTELALPDIKDDDNDSAYVPLQPDSTVPQ